MDPVRGNQAEPPPSPNRHGDHTPMKIMGLTTLMFWTLVPLIIVAVVLILYFVLR